jgi:hypothetical protein
MKPAFTHDCDCCKFLGTYKKHDLYFCAQDHIFPTLIARYSDDGPDYMSGLSFAKVSPMLGEAASRALAQGYLSQATLDKWTKQD